MVLMNGRYISMIPLQFASLYDDQKVFVCSGCLLDLGRDFCIGKMAFVWEAWVAPHFHCSYSLQLCHEGPWFTCIQEDGCDKGGHQSYLGAVRNTPTIPNWFQLCQYCCCLYYPGEYLRLGTIIRYNWYIYITWLQASIICSQYLLLHEPHVGVTCTWS